MTTSMYTYIDDFAKQTGNGKYPDCPRPDVVKDLKARMAKPSLVNQSMASLCGPACLSFIILSKLPAMYAAYVMSLYDGGSAKLGGLLVKPSDGCRNAKLGGKIAAVDWVGLASLRDSENSDFEYNDPDDAFPGITMPGGLEDWFKALKFGSVREETNLVRTKGADNLKEAGRLHAAGHSVCLLIWSDVLKGHRAGFISFADHWVVMTRQPSFNANKTVSFEVYTWGQTWPVNVSQDLFFRAYYGYVSGKFH